MRNAFIDALYYLAKNNKNILGLVGDSGAGVFDKFKADFKDQFINFGLAEANMITVAAGLASSGFIPFTYAIGPHIVCRPYEQIRNDVCLNNSNVKIVSVGVGLHYSNQGPTHHMIEDLTILKVLPNITIFSPSSPMEAKKMTIEASFINGPVYIRIGRATDTKLDYEFTLGKGVQLRNGKDVTLFATGATVYDAYQASLELEKDNISVRVINIHTIKPLDEEIILKAAHETKVIITIEEHQLQGGFGESIARVILEDNSPQVIFKRMGIKDVFCSYNGTYHEVQKYYGLSTENIIMQVKNLYEVKE